MSDKPMIYEIRLKGHLGYHWEDWFEGALIKLKDNGETLLICPIVDQAALHGVLRKVRDLGITLISVSLAESDQPDTCL